MTPSSPSRFEIALGELAAEYGVPLEDGLEERASDVVTLYRDDECWHVNDPDLFDGDWAPTSDAQASEIYASLLAGGLSNGS